MAWGVTLHVAWAVLTVGGTINIMKQVFIFLKTNTTFINLDQNRWNPKSAKRVAIAMVFAFSFGFHLEPLSMV